MHENDEEISIDIWALVFDLKYSIGLWHVGELQKYSDI